MTHYKRQSDAELSGLFRRIEKLAGIPTIGYEPKVGIFPFL